MVYTECNPTTCPCGEQCSNLRIQRHLWWKSLERFATSNRGYGVKTTKTISVGKFIKKG